AQRPGMTLMEAEVFGNLKASDDGLGLSCAGRSVGRSLQNELRSLLLGEALDDQESYEECENQNDCHCLILRPLAGARFEFSRLELSSWLAAFALSYRSLLANPRAE